MDKKQIHKFGKAINKPIKFVKKNIIPIVTVGGSVASTIAIIKNNNKK